VQRTRKLAIDPAGESQRIEAFITDAVASLKKDGVVLGLSGGLDSAVVACLAVRALTPKRVLGLILPERDSDPRSQADACKLAQGLGIETKEIDLAPTLKDLGTYRPIPRWAARPWLVRAIYKRFKKKKGVSYLIHSLGPPAERPEFSFAAFALPKLRLRMIILYQYASRLNRAVIGTTNRTEWEVGHYDRYGDGACDIDPIIHLYKTQVRTLAHYLGVPEGIIAKPPSPDLIGGITDEIALGISYAKLDQILLLLTQGATTEEIEEASRVPTEAVEEVRQAVNHAREARRLPLSLRDGAFECPVSGERG
jgi:NAD+ synthase